MAEKHLHGSMRMSNEYSYYAEGYGFGREKFPNMCIKSLRNHVLNDHNFLYFLVSDCFECSIYFLRICGGCQEFGFAYISSELLLVGYYTKTCRWNN